MQMIKQFFTLLFMSLFISCSGQDKIDLSKLNLNELIEDVINFDDKKTIGIETVEYPFCLLIEIENSSIYNFDGIDLKGLRIFFQINSEQLKTDEHIKYGGGHIDLQYFKTKQELVEILKSFQAKNKIYGFRIEMDSDNLKTEILGKIENRYGTGIKNPNTANGLYWNVNDENKYIFYAPDYDRLVVINSSDLSKSCYWDGYNGVIDFGGCDYDEYIRDLTKNSMEPEDIEEKISLKIDQDWNVNELVLGKSSEPDFVKSSLNSNFEKATSISITDSDIMVIYQNSYNNLYFYSTCNENETDNTSGNILKGYSIPNFDGVDIQFANGLKANLSKDEILKIFNNSQIENFDELKFSNYIEIKNNIYTIHLILNENDLFTSMYVLKKD